MQAALVTGAAGGLGKYIALALSKNRYSVVVNYRSSGDAARSILDTMDKDSFAVKADVRSSEDVEAMADRIDSRLGRLDVIINNAGVTKDSLLLKQTEREWDEITGANLKGCFNLIKIMAPIMIRSGGGHIVNISSYSGIKGKSGQAAYSASKAALLGLTVTAAHELAEYNIRVNALLPGYMATGMGMKAGRAMESARESSIIKRLSDPGDTAEFILYLLKTENITGQVFSLDSRII
ncbi:MAG: SDR family NAD(P)-dependent oxidoreductase [Nitrospirota bacterium]|nr:SDR family NAD(P)-dependent oxidoreductase [Nitrospirota bacterium]